MFGAVYNEKLTNYVGVWHQRDFSVWVLVAAFLLLAGCDGGLEPPPAGTGAFIRGTITYSGRWPDADSVRDLRFVALRFIPVDTTDFLQLNRIEVSRRLSYGVENDTFSLNNVEPGVFPYSGVARQINANLFSWAPLALYNETDGVLALGSGDTIQIVVNVDFEKIPPFPRTAMTSNE
ncbi:MAG: hypothetical protein R2832_01815 [Rhodothermales bacterium]